MNKKLGSFLSIQIYIPWSPFSHLQHYLLRKDQKSKQYRDWSVNFQEKKIEPQRTLKAIEKGQPAVLSEQA